MAAPAAGRQQSSTDPIPPSLEPGDIRARLTSDVAAEFDREWHIVLDEAKRTQDLAPVHDLLVECRHFACAELTQPGTYFRVLAADARTLATGQPPPGSVSGDELATRIARRLGR